MLNQCIICVIIQSCYAPPPKKKIQICLYKISKEPAFFLLGVTDTFRENLNNTCKNIILHGLGVLCYPKFN